MPVTLNQNQLIAAGRVLAELGANAKIESLRVDGKEVTDLDGARAALAAADTPVAEEAPGVIGRFTDGMASKLGSFEEKLAGPGWKAKLRKLISADPERVVTRVMVEAKLADGSELCLPVEVLDREATRLLQRASSISEIIGMVPLLGYLAPILAAAGAAIGAGISRLLGRDALADSMLNTAGKHAALFAAGLIPVLGSATSAAAAAIDHIDARNASRAPSVAEIVNL